MAQVTQTSTRFYAGITDVESSVKCVQKREYSRNIDTTYTTLHTYYIQKKTREKVIQRATRTHAQNCGFYWPRAYDAKMW